MDPSKIDAIVSAWHGEGETLTYSEIKQHLVSKDIIKETNDRSLSRWLKSLVNDGLLKKTEEGYFLQMKPKEYQVFDYLNEVRQKYGHLVYEGEVGGLFSHICALTYLNFEEKLLEKSDEKTAFDIISMRIAELFWALYSLRNAIVKRRCGLKRLRLPEIVVRETFFGMLNASVGIHHGTEEIVERYSHSFQKPWKASFQQFWKTVKPRRGRQDEYFDLPFADILLGKITGDVESFKKRLKKTASLDIDKYTVEQLTTKFGDIRKWIEKKHEKEMAEKHVYVVTPRESELENNYRIAILTKVAEKIEQLETDLEDFAVVLTKHPGTMEQYYTSEHILYEAMDWAKKPPEDEFLRNTWYEISKKEKTFEGMVAERLVTMGRLSVQEYEKLRTTPWVAKELTKLGDFDRILELYSRKLEKRIRRQGRRGLRRILGLPTEAHDEATG